MTEFLTSVPYFPATFFYLIIIALVFWVVGFLKNEVFSNSRNKKLFYYFGLLFGPFLLFFTSFFLSTLNVKISDRYVVNLGGVLYEKKYIVKYSLNSSGAIDLSTDEFIEDNIQLEKIGKVKCPFKDSLRECSDKLKDKDIDSIKLKNEDKIVIYLNRSF